MDFTLSIKTLVKGYWSNMEVLCQSNKVFMTLSSRKEAKKEWSAIDDLNRSSHDCGTLPAFLKTASFCRTALKLPNPWSSLCDVGKMGHLFIMGLTRADKSYKITVKQFLSVLPGHSNIPSELLGCKTFFLPLICAHQFSNQMEAQLLISEPRRGTGSRWKRVCFSLALRRFSSSSLQKF